MHRIGLVARLLLLALLLGSPPPASAQDWVEVRSPNFTVVSNAGEGRARDFAWQFEQIRWAIRAGWSWARAELDRPVVVIVARNESTMRDLVPRYWEDRDRVRPASVFASGPDRHYVAVRADIRLDSTPDMNPYVSSYWSYGLLTFDAAGGQRLPLWFRVGLAEVLSNSIVGNDEVRFGLPIPQNVRLLQGPRLRLAELFEITSESPYFREGLTRANFDAQAWGLVHYLLFGRPEDRADHVNTLARALLEGNSTSAVVTQLFGSVETLENAYLQYHRRPISSYGRLPLDQNAMSRDFPASPMTEGASLGVRAGLHVSLNQVEDARALIAEGLSADSPDAAVHVAQGMLLDRQGETAGARAAFARAVELGSDSYYPYYRLSSLAMSDLTDETAPVVEQHLRRAIELNGVHSPSYMLLANVLLQAGRPAEAVDPATRAMQLDVQGTFPRLTLARALWSAGQRLQAVSQARAGLALAQDDQDRAAAQRLVDQLQALLDQLESATN